MRGESVARLDVVTIDPGWPRLDAVPIGADRRCDTMADVREARYFIPTTDFAVLWWRVNRNTGIFEFAVSDEQDIASLTFTFPDDGAEALLQLAQMFRQMADDIEWLVND